MLLGRGLRFELVRALDERAHHVRLTTGATSLRSAVVDRDPLEWARPDDSVVIGERPAGSCAARSGRGRRR